MMSSEITEIINTLCEKLGVAANVLVPEMARYYIARLIFFTLIETIFAIIVAIAFVRIVRWIFIETNTDWEDRAFRIFFVALIPGILLIFLFVSSVSNAADLIGWIVSPTASAVRVIASLIK